MARRCRRRWDKIAFHEPGRNVRVNTSDSGPFGLTFLKATGTGGYLAQFDFDGDGRITTTDDRRQPSFHFSDN